MKKIILSLLLTSLFGSGYAQTNVSGGIFSNTTWTLAGSPYIVVDTTVVFPGVTLTIEPGVLVKFDDDLYLEIRQGTLIANGTITDSITFTSNNPAPTPGIWGKGNDGGIYLNGSVPNAFFNFCNISYAVRGLSSAQHLKNSSFTYNEVGIGNLGNITVDSCVFKYHTTGPNAVGVSSISGTTMNHCSISNNDMGVYTLNDAVLNNCTFDSNGLAFGGATGTTYDSEFHYCSISNNQNGLNAHGIGGNLLSHCIINNNTVQGVSLGMATGAPDQVIDCEIKFNGKGVRVGSGNAALITRCDIENNTTGIEVSSASANIYCNKICNNTSYGLQMNTSANFNADDNYWCTNDSAQIAAAIYDGYDNVNFGLVTFLPTDSTCYQSTGILENTNTPIGFSIFPNPTTGIIQLTLAVRQAGISTKHNAPLKCEIMNMMGERVFTSPLIPLQRRGEAAAQLDVSFLAKGIYLVRVGDGERWENKKLVVE